MIKVLTNFVKCTDCAKSEMNGVDLVCTEFQEVIECDETMCSAFEAEEDEINEKQTM